MQKTAKEIRQHLKEGSPHQTSAPCPGCGFQYRGYRDQPKPFRRADSVCADCRKLIEEALKIREETAAQHERRLYFVARNGYYEGHKTGKTFGDIHNLEIEEWIGAMRGRKGRQSHPVEPGYVIERCLALLASELASPLPMDSGPDGSLERVYEKPGPHGYTGEQGQKLWLRPEHALLLRTLDVAIRQALIDRSEAGEEHGRNLLLGLASGELSIQKFNEATTKKNA